MGSSGYSLIDIFFLLVREHRQFLQESGVWLLLG